MNSSSGAGEHPARSGKASHLVLEDLRGENDDRIAVHGFDVAEDHDRLFHAKERVES